MELDRQAFTLTSVVAQAIYTVVVIIVVVIIIIAFLIVVEHFIILHSFLLSILSTAIYFY